ncbi:MAG: glycosyl transferase [Amaricoccus sp.]
MKQVICISWGTKYGAPYVNRLYAMVARNITPPFSFTCFTDSAEGFRPEVRAEPLPPLDVKMPTGTKGIWPKARLWSATLADLTGPVLFMDLDLVVVGSLDDFFSFGDPEDVILARNPNTPLERLGQTSIFRFPVGKLLPLQERFLADPQGVADTYQFEQRYVTREAPGGVHFWPAPWVRHFRYHCARPLPLNFFMAPRLPSDARVVIFPGALLPPHAIAGHWGRAYRPGSAAAHLRGLFAADRPDRPLRYLRHYLRPTPWVADAWRED